MGQGKKGGKQWMESESYPVKNSLRGFDNNTGAIRPLPSGRLGVRHIDVELIRYLTGQWYAILKHCITLLCSLISGYLYSARDSDSKVVVSMSIHVSHHHRQGHGTLPGLPTSTISLRRVPKHIYNHFIPTFNYLYPPLSKKSPLCRSDESQVHYIYIYISKTTSRHIRRPQQPSGNCNWRP